MSEIQHDIGKAQAAASQTQRQLDMVELKAEVDIRTAYSGYRAAVARVRKHHDELLRAADVRPSRTKKCA